MLVRDYLLAQARSAPDRVAFVDGHRRFTWSEVLDRASRLAAAMRAQGVEKGHVVASLALDGIETIDVWFASAILGTVRTGINWRYSTREVEHILRDADVRLIVVESGAPSETLGDLGEGRLTCVLRFGEDASEYDAALAAAAPLDPTTWPPLGPEDAIAISYTTGSTGLPKGAIWRQGAVVTAQLHTWMEAGGRRDDVYLHCIPAAGVPILLATWNVFVGSTIVLQARFLPGETLALIERERVTSTLLVPTMISDILVHPDFERFDLSSMRLLIYGSAPATPALVERTISAFDCDIQQWYGSTEGAGGWFSILRHDDHVRALREQPELLQSCGRSMVHVEIMVLDAKGAAVPIGDVGEVCVRSETLMDRYLGLPEETAEALSDGWLHTGDLGRVDGEGFLFLVDRRKFMIITGAYNVYPVVVENVVGAHPSVHQVCVVGVPDERWGETVCAVIVANKPVTADEVIEFCRPDLATFEVPKHVVFVDELPVGATGKILKRAVRDEMRNRLGPA